MDEEKCDICGNFMIDLRICKVSLYSPETKNSSHKICENCKRKLDMITGVQAQDFKIQGDSFIPVNFNSSKEMRAERKRRNGEEA